MKTRGPDRTIRQWDAVTAKELGRFTAPDTGFTSLAVTPDGNYSPVPNQESMWHRVFSYIPVFV